VVALDKLLYIDSPCDHQSDFRARICSGLFRRPTVLTWSAVVCPRCQMASRWRLASMMAQGPKLLGSSQRHLTGPEIARRHHSRRFYAGASGSRVGLSEWKKEPEMSSGSLSPRGQNVLTTAYCRSNHYRLSIGTSVKSRHRFSHDTPTVICKWRTALECFPNHGQPPDAGLPWNVPTPRPVATAVAPLV
jgi:hypothetical protein